MLFVVYKPLKIGEFSGINRKVLVIFHIVNIKINAVERNSCPVVAVDYAVNRLAVVVAPAALLKAERPKRRNIALAD